MLQCHYLSCYEVGWEQLRMDLCGFSWWWGIIFGLWECSLCHIFLKFLVLSLEDIAYTSLETVFLMVKNVFLTMVLLASFAWKVSKRRKTLHIRVLVLPLFGSNKLVKFNISFYLRKKCEASTTNSLLCRYFNWNFYFDLYLISFINMQTFTSDSNLFGNFASSYSSWSKGRCAKIRLS